MKLELNHLVYQTFKPLRVYFAENNIDLIQSVDYCDGIIGFLNRNEAYLLSQNPFKLILKPISDLQKDKKFLDLYFTSNDKSEGFMVKRKNETFARIDEITYLYREHYDIHGLIEKGLAISVHDVSAVS